jgi:hypothetical protein
MMPETRPSTLTIDVSPNNDWSMVKVWYGPTGGLGTSAYPTKGAKLRLSSQGVESPRLLDRSGEGHDARNPAIVARNQTLTIDVSPNNDWSMVKVWYGPTGGLGTSAYPKLRLSSQGVESPRLLDRSGEGHDARNPAIVARSDERDVRAIDVSPNNDWSMVKVWYGPTGGLGTSAYPTKGRGR